MRTLRKQLNNSRLFFWSGVAHWTTRPLRFKYYQLGFVLNRSAWSFGTNQNAFFTNNLQNYTSSKQLNSLFIFSHLNWNPYYYICTLHALRLFNFYVNWTQNSHPNAGIKALDRNINTLHIQIKNSNLLPWQRGTKKTVNAYQPSTQYYPNSKQFFSFFFHSFTNFNLILCSLSRLLGTRKRALFKTRLRLRYYHFLQHGSSLRINFLMRSWTNARNKYKRKRKITYNFFHFFLLKNSRTSKHKVSSRLITGLFGNTAHWWRYTIMRGLRTTYRLGLHLYSRFDNGQHQHNSVVQTSSSKSAPVFFLFFRSLLRRLEYRTTHSQVRLALTWKIIMWQKNCITRFNNFIHRIRPTHKDVTQYPNYYQSKRAKLAIQMFSRGSLLPSPYVAGYKRNWFISRTSFFGASRRLLRSRLPWRAGLSFLNRRRRRNRLFFTIDPNLREINCPTMRRIWRRFLPSRVSITLRLRYLNLLQSGLRPRTTHTFRNLALPLTLPNSTLVNNLNAKTTISVFNNLRLIASKAAQQRLCIGINTDSLINLSPKVSVASSVLRYWRLLISGKLSNDKPRRRFIPLQGSYVSTYYSSYINRFFEYFLGTRVGTLINFEILARVSPEDFFFLESVKSRLFAMNSAFSTIFFINEFIDLLFMALRLRDFSHLISYINRLLKSLVIWDHKRFFVFFFSAFREQFLPFFPMLGITGLQIIIRGKVGVGGNSRKRSMALRLGVTSRTHTFVNVNTINTWLNTTTGALGLRIFLYGTNEI
uniref:Ribosomal protein S3 n=1 Tax=Euplotes crassus TaxID=5936 RepID=D1LDS3_EUPCR|nr:ribosomal protein S3 [Moneuplotes crassus]